MYPPAGKHNQSLAATVALRNVAILSVEEDKMMMMAHSRRRQGSAANHVGDDDDQASLAETDSIGSCAVTDEDGCIGTTISQLDDGARERTPSCDACPHCADRCANVGCSDCAIKTSGPHQQPQQHREAVTCTVFPLSPRSCRRTKNPLLLFSKDDSTAGAKASYTMCEVRRHNHIHSAWIVVGKDIYDATPYLHSHPGGVDCILKRSGGAKDCSMDYQFHSKRGQQLFKRYHVGTLERCPGEGPTNKPPPLASSSSGKREWWMFWES